MESLSVLSFLIKLRIHLYAEDVVRASRARLLLQSYNPLILFSDFFPHGFMTNVFRHT